MHDVLDLRDLAPDDAEQLAVRRARPGAVRRAGRREHSEQRT
ncbi:hypothetical protein [Kribbella flavida]|nr:hypothetical protein [Kribbella flavida]